jgi:Protein kinase domain
MSCVSLRRSDRGPPHLSTCDTVQHALIAGEPSSLLAPHLQVCADCTLLVQALGQLRPDTQEATQVEVQPRALLHAMVDGLVAGSRLLGRYQIHHRLGAGGEGWVYAALDTETSQEVAIKFGASDALPGFVNAQTVVHENVCPVFYTTVVAGVRIVVMRFVSGGSLADRVGQLDLQGVLAIMQGVCAGLAAVHAAGLVHLDIKPGNVLMDGARPLIVDFGLSTRSGQSCVPGRGTQGYMAPEQRAGQVVTGATDVFALAGLFRALLRGQPPRRIEAVLRRALAPDPSRRPADAGSFWTQLRRASRSQRAPWLLAAAAAAALGGLWFTQPAIGVRASWHPELWGKDTVAADHWNVALNRGTRAPFIEASAPAVGCARSLSELIDGLALYQEAPHGYAFAGASARCLPLGPLQDCGALSPEGPRCLLGSEAAVVVDPGLVAPEDRGRLGQYQPASTCSEEVALTVTLARAHRVSAVRAWFREGIPQRLRLEVETEQGTWQSVFATRENRQWVGVRRRLPGHGVGSVPVTIHFQPSSTRKLRLLLRCDPEEPLGRGGQPPEAPWLYELELFAPLGRLQAWSRTWSGSG